MSVGTVLQQARHERKLSLADVTEKTKIQPWVLEALEADRLPQAMSPIYVKGFLSTYARFLHVDPEPLVRQLAWPQPPQPEPPQELPVAPPPPAVSIRLPWAAIRRAVVRVAKPLAISGALVGLVVINPLRWMPKLSLPKFQFPTFAAATPVSGPAKEKRAHASAKPRGLIRAASATPAPRPAAPKTEEPVAATLASVAPVSGPSILPPPQPPAVAPVQPMELVMTASRTTWIRVRADGKLLAQQRLSRGAEERWSAHRQFEVVVSKPSQVELALNGQSISPFLLAHQGRLVITRQGIVGLADAQ